MKATKPGNITDTHIHFNTWYIIVSVFIHYIDLFVYALNICACISLGAAWPRSFFGAEDVFVAQLCWVFGMDGEHQGVVRCSQNLLLEVPRGWRILGRWSCADLKVMFIIRPWGLFRGCKSDLLRDVLVAICGMFVLGFWHTFDILFREWPWLKHKPGTEEP